MPVAAYMSAALYDPRLGYYSRAPRAGRAGHFLTSPELDAGFGALWAGAFEQVWQSCERPSSFEVVEVGPGEGGFAAAVLEAAAKPFSDALSYRLVERMPELRTRQEKRLAPWLNAGAGRPRVAWSPSLVEVPPVSAGCVWANEVLDNLPVHLVERRAGRLHEVCVMADAGVLAEVLLPPSSPELQRFLDRCEVELEDGYRYEVGLAAESFTRRAAGLVGQGAAIFVDYGAEAGELARWPGGSLVCYSAAGADDSYLELPGSKDITAHVNWSAVRQAGERAGLTMAGPLAQREVLKALGLGALSAQIEAARSRALEAGDGAAAVRALSRGQALAVVADPDGLGALGVIGGAKAAPPPPFLAALGQ